MNINIEIGSKWQHHNHVVYEVIDIANEFSINAEYPITIVYRSSNGKIWCKELSNFLANMKPYDS